MDTKPIPPSTAGFPSEIRRHYFLRSCVIIAAGRAKRPDAPHGRNEEHVTDKPSAPDLDAEPGIIELGNENGQWAVKIIPNRFPAVSPDFPQAFGYHEIVVETPRHGVEFSELPITHIELIIEAWKQRITALSQEPGIKYVAIFKNDGPSAGASINQAHSQLMALGMVPPKLLDVAEAVLDYRLHHDGRCPWCDIIAQEEAQEVRIIYADEHIVALAPYASTAGYEAWILPRRHHRRLADLNEAELHSLARILKSLTASLDSVPLSFNFSLQYPLTADDDHFMVKLEPRLSVWGGFELETGIIVNIIAPEAAAAWYRQKLDQK